jgi:hypothetical protein
MIQRLRSVLLIVATASFLANGAHAITGASAASERGPIDTSSVTYVQSDGFVSAVSFRVADGSHPVRIRVSATDSWHACDPAGSKVVCQIGARPLSDVNRLEIQPA